MSCAASFDSMVRRVAQVTVRKVLTVASQKPEPSTPEIVGKTLGFSVLIAVVGVALLFIIAVIAWTSYGISMDKNSKAGESRRTQEEISASEALEQNPYLSDGEGRSSYDGGTISADLDYRAFSEPDEFARAMMKTFESEDVDIVHIGYGGDKTMSVSRSVFETKAGGGVNASVSTMSEQTWKDLLQLVREEQAEHIDVTEDKAAHLYLGEIVDGSYTSASNYNQQIFRQKIQNVDDLKTPDGLESIVLEDAFTYTRGDETPVEISVSVRASKKDEVMPVVEAVMAENWSPELLRLGVTSVKTAEDGSSADVEGGAALHADVSLNSYANRYEVYDKDTKRQKAVDNAQKSADAVLKEVHTPLEVEVSLLETNAQYNDQKEDAVEVRNF